MKLFDVLIKPLITEKNTALQAENKFVFEVSDAATKPQIKQAVEKAFSVSVTGVNIIRAPGKMKRMGRSQFKTSEWKKAIVTLKSGDKIQVFEGV